MHYFFKSALLFVLLATYSFAFAADGKLDLSGIWQVHLDSSGTGLQQNRHNSAFEQPIKLPGTTDDAGLGIANTLTPKLEKPQVLRLTRKNSYVGPAWYTREIIIPKNWKNKQLTLKLERVIWETRVWINGREVQSKQESLSTPHYFDLTNYLKPGKQRLTIRVDNSKKYDISVHLMAHAYTNETQIIWNGILGEISCIAEEKIRIDEIQVYPDVTNKRIKVRVDVLNFTGKKLKSQLQMSALLKNSADAVAKKSYPVQINSERESFTFDYPMGASPALWDEFSPNLYTLNVSLVGKKTISSKQTQFGMRELGNQNRGLQINGKNIFLRGTLECAIFPLTGYPPMEKEGWRKLMLSAREWGLNHLRFHSWCPPKAAFEAADELGFYLQAELPLWSLNINKDEPTNQFLFAEADRIIREYGNHPSFCYWSLGNELQPDFKFLNEFVDKLKQKDPRRLYTNTSFTFEKGHGKWPERNDDFFITQYTDKGWVRGQGVFDTESPTFTKDYAQSVAGLPVPLITHEIGQYAVYPNLEEIKKYTGVLDPLNFKAVKADLEQKGLAHKAHDYLMASGKLAAILYKEEIERALKTTGISGFQLLDLHDFPGQGTALVGLLDAFWDSKGLIDAAKFREFSAPVVPLIRYAKAAYSNNEIFTAEMEVSNFGKADLLNKRLKWSVKDHEKELLTGFSKQLNAPVGKLTSGGKIELKLNEITKASKLLVEVAIEGTDYRNSWEIWVYPASQIINSGSVVVTSDKEEALLALETGRKVLFSPKTEKIQGLEGKFVQVFWSPVHFPNQPGTMGLLINPAHPAFSLFPTEMHTNWQWWDLCKKSRTINIDNIPGATAIVENVDNFMKNRRLCSVFETQMAKGQLLFSSMDLISNIDNRPEAKQLLISLLKYMNSEQFSPTGRINREELNLLITE